MSQSFKKKVLIPTDTGEYITGYLYCKEESCYKASVLIASAIGVPQGYYHAFSSWLAELGYCVLTFDYLGIGESKHKHLKFNSRNLLDWGQIDTASALKFLDILTPQSLPIYWIGHSLGGQLCAYVEGSQRIKKLITVASGSGYWKDNSPQLKRKVPLLWFVAVPLTLPLFGYFPGKKLGMVGDLPKQVILQWKEWALNKQYIGVLPDAKQKFSEFTVPIHSISFTDDELMSAESIRVLHSLYTHSEQTSVRINPETYQLKSIGHFGFFKASMKPLWEQLVLPELN